MPTEIDINNYRTILLTEVGDQFQNTMGSIEIAIYGKTTTFVIVTENFDIPCEGILGVTYLTDTGAIIDYGSGIIQIGETIEYLKCRKEPSTMDKQHCLAVEEKLKNTTNPIVINENQNIALNPTEAENKINCTWCLDTNVSAIPQIYNDENQLQDMDEEIPKSSDENFSVAIDFKSLELLDLDYSTKPYFQDILNEVSSELNFKNYSIKEVNETFQIFEENSSQLPFVKVYSIENHEVTPKEANLLSKLRFEHLNEEEREHTMNLILFNQDRFYRKGQKLGVASTVMHRIPTIDDIPINVKQYKIPISLKDDVERQVQELLKNGIIKPSTSPYNSPLWIVPKKWTLLKNKNGV